MQIVDVSIVLPCYNPSGKWKENVIRRFTELLPHIPNAELIVVNDGSTSNFLAEEVQKFFDKNTQIRLVSYPTNKGKGYALRHGVTQARGKYIIYTDIDFPYTLESLLQIYNRLQTNCDVVVGIRSEEYYTHLPAARVFISKFLRLLIRKFLRIPTDDTQCGLKGFNQKGKEVFLSTTIERYLFDLEFIFIAARRSLLVQTVRVSLREGVELSSMPWKILLQEFGNFLKVFWSATFSRK